MGQKLSRILKKIYEQEHVPNHMSKVEFVSKSSKKSFVKKFWNCEQQLETMMLKNIYEQWY